MNNHRSDIALFRYALIRQACDPGVTKSQRGVVVRELASTPHRDPLGRHVMISRGTLDRWVRAYLTGGFEALHPKPLARMATTPVELLELAVGLKTEEPARTATQVAMLIATAKGFGPSARTLQRHFLRLGLDAAPGSRRVFGRFEAPAPNDRWIGDGLHGCVVGNNNTMLFVFLDDHSRFITGRRWFHASGEAIHPVCHALRLGLESQGLPDSIYVDNGSAYSSKPFARACASLGIRLVHSRPGKPEGRGKVERFFKTVRDQFLVEVPHGEVTSIEELNRRFDSWVETVYHRRIHSETNATPLERFDAGGVQKVPSKDQLHEAFLWSEMRTVTKTATVSLYSNTFEVDAALVGRKIELIFDPFDLTAIEVRHDTQSFGRARPHVVGRHVHPQVVKHITDDVLPSGIDYLGLVARRQDEQRRKDNGGPTLFRDLQQQQIDVVEIHADEQIPGQLTPPESEAL